MQFQVTSTANLFNSKWKSEGPIMVMPFTDEAQALRAGYFAASRAGTEGLILAIRDATNQGFIKTVNQAFKVTDSPYFGYMAQDAFAGRKWMAYAQNALDKSPKHNFLSFNDGKWHGILASFGLAKRPWAANNYGGDFFYPVYDRHYADTELTLLAIQDGCLVYEPNSVLVEVDWGKDLKHTSQADKDLYASRKTHGFAGRVTTPALLKLFK